MDLQSFERTAAEHTDAKAYEPELVSQLSLFFSDAARARIAPLLAEFVYVHMLLRKRNTNTSTNTPQIQRD